MIKQMLVAYLKNSMRSPVFLLSVVFMALSSLISQSTVWMDLWKGSDIWEAGYIWQYMNRYLESDVCCFLIPVLSTIPASAAAAEEISCGFYKNTVPRCGREGWIRIEIIRCGMCGGGVLFVGILAGTAVSRMLLGLVRFCLYIRNGRSILSDGSMGTGYPMEDVRKMMIMVLLVLMMGVLWSLFGMFLSFVAGSSYAAWIGPFICCYLGIILHERYLPHWFLGYQPGWIHPVPGWPGGEGGVFVWICLLCIWLAVLCRMAMERKVGCG